MISIISIDPSKRSTGIYIKTEEEEYFKTFSLPSGFVYYSPIFEYYKNIINEYKIDLGIIEDYRFNMSATTSLTILAEIAGIIKYTFESFNIPLIIMPIQTWKKYSIERGKRLFKVTKKDKAEYIDYVKEKYNKIVETPDQADAYMIYFALKQIVEKKENLTDTDKRIREQIKQIIKEKANDGRN
jgi:Holliday junction resolvasome RuvABC endonuclease subunit